MIVSVWKLFSGWSWLKMSTWKIACGQNALPAATTLVLMTRTTMTTGKTRTKLMWCIALFTVIEAMVKVFVCLSTLMLFHRHADAAVAGPDSGHSAWLLVESCPVSTGMPTNGSLHQEGYPARTTTSISADFVLLYKAIITAMVILSSWVVMTVGFPISLVL